eukprot:1572095-Alexandrium_andersonii.AAC.1
MSGINLVCVLRVRVPAATVQLSCHRQQAFEPAHQSSPPFSAADACIPRAGLIGCRSGGLSCAPEESTQPLRSGGSGESPTRHHLAGVR